MCSQVVIEEGWITGHTVSKQGQKRLLFKVKGQANIFWKIHFHWGNYAMTRRGGMTDGKFSALPILTLLSKIIFHKSSWETGSSHIVRLSYFSRSLCSGFQSQSSPVMYYLHFLHFNFVYSQFRRQTTHQKRKRMQISFSVVPEFLVPVFLKCGPYKKTCFFSEGVETCLSFECYKFRKKFRF